MIHWTEAVQTFENEVVTIAAKAKAKRANATKTNATRLCETLDIPHRTLPYDIGDGANSGREVAAKLDIAEEAIFKTLVTIGASDQVYVFVIPVAGDLDLKRAAKAVGEKSMVLLPVKELFRVTGYVKGGCSPLGMKKQYPTVFDAELEQLERVTFNAGKVGLQIQLPVERLAELIPYTVAAVSRSV